jgi:hypothetical protein
MADRYHVQVRVREGGDTYAWRRVRPTHGDPYVFTREEGEAYIRSADGAHGHDPANYRLEPLPE